MELIYVGREIGNFMRITAGLSFKAPLSRGHSPIPHNHSLLVKAHLKVADCRRRRRARVTENNALVRTISLAAFSD
jgi:hypothetical protein